MTCWNKSDPAWTLQEMKSLSEEELFYLTADESSSEAVHVGCVLSLPVSPVVILCPQKHFVDARFVKDSVNVS